MVPRAELKRDSDMMGAKRARAVSEAAARFISTYGKVRVKARRLPEEVNLREAVELQLLKGYRRDAFEAKERLQDHHQRGLPVAPFDYEEDCIPRGNQDPSVED
jgi:hypothetical protein